MIAAAPSILTHAPPPDGSFRRLLKPAPLVSLVGSRDDKRAEVERHIAARYASMYGAQLTHFMPRFLALECLGAISGVVGMQTAGTNPLFLERYLDRPVDETLGKRLGRPVARDSLVEIGNLVASGRGVSQLLFLLFTATLHEAGYAWIVFTATRSLRSNLEKLGVPLLELKRVDAARLDPGLLAQWGSYYQTEPAVMAGNLSSAMELIAAHPLMRQALAVYRGQIDMLATQFNHLK